MYLNLDNLTDEQKAKVKALVGQLEQENDFLIQHTINGNKYCIDSRQTVESLTLINREDFAEVLKCFPMEGRELEVKTAGKSYWSEVNFCFGIDNGVNEIKAYMKYMFGETMIIVRGIKTEWIEEFLVNASRKLSSFENHYFADMSKKKRGELNLACKRFGVLNCVNYYGGNVECLDGQKNDEILNYLITNKK